MELIYRAQTNMVSILGLIVVLIIALNKLDRRENLNRFYIIAGFIVLAEIIFETATVFLNNHDEVFIIYLSSVFHTFMFIGAPVLTFSFYLLIRKIIHPFEADIDPKVYPLLIPLVVNALLAITSPYTGWIFRISVEGVYQRGPLFLLFAAFTYFYMFMGMLMVVKFRNHIIKTDFITLALISLVPVVGGAFQALVYGILTMWSSAAFALLIAYSFLQDRMVRLDDLTKAWTRESFYAYISRKIFLNRNEQFCAIYFDVDNLKEINDEFGHLEGDYMLQEAINLIRSHLSPKDILARLGGDEFIIIMNCNSKKDLDATVLRMKTSLLISRETNIFKHQIDCSFGADVYSNEYTSLESFIHHIDHLMYEEKRRKKRVPIK